MATLVVFALCQAGVAPWWTLWPALALDAIVTLGITVAITAADHRCQTGHEFKPPTEPSRPGRRLSG
jgi:hypothetical protein